MTLIGAPSAYVIPSLGNQSYDKSHYGPWHMMYIKKCHENVPRSYPPRGIFNPFLAVGNDSFWAPVL